MRTLIWHLLPIGLVVLSSCSKVDGTHIEGSADNQDFLKREIQHYRDILSQDSTYGKGHLGLGWAFLQQKKYETAVSHFIKAIEYDKAHSAYLGLGICYEQLNKLDLARETYNDILKQRPDWYFVSYQLGRLDIRENRQSRALERLNTVMKYDKVMGEILLDQIYQ